MKNLKIKAKLLLGFTLVSALALIVGVVGIVGLSASNSRHKELLTISNAGISSMADMREYFLQQRYLVRSAMLNILQNPEKIESDIENFKIYEAKMADAMLAYERTIIDPSAEQNYYMAKDAYENVFLPTNKKIMAAAQLGDIDAAMAALSGGGNAAVIIGDGINGTVDYMNFLLEQDTAELESHSAQMMAIQITVMILAVVCAMILGVYNASMLGKPIKTMSDFFVRFGTTGDLEISEEDQKNIAAQQNNHDEIGKCIGAAAQMVGRLIEINETLGKVSAGDLTVDFEPLSEKDSIGVSVSKVIDRLNSIFSSLSAASGQVSTGSEQIAQGAQELATGASQQAAKIEEFSKSLSELRDKTQANAENSRQAQEVNGKAITMLDESIKSMGEMLDAMKDIDESSKSITKVIKVIDDIAFQTNILALNAAVEAARAGLHGKGFAVVADEVRNLASKSADAAKETAALIEGSSEKVKEGNQIVYKTNASLSNVAEGAKGAFGLLETVSKSSSEQAQAIVEINQNIEQISNVVQENSASAQESAAASEEMSSQAVMLNEIVAKFKLKAPNNAVGSLNTGITTGTPTKTSSMGISQASITDVRNHHEKY